MKTKNYIFSTKKIKNKNNINEILINSGIIKKISSGLYTYMPTGNILINNINNIIKKEMKKINALEIILPILQSLNITILNEKFNKYKNKIINLKLNNKNFILSPTNEEIISYIMKNEIDNNKMKNSLIFYQIQNKFRNELRNRCSIIRTKEFIMKEAYSFHNKLENMLETYEKFKNIYIKIFKNFKINFKIVKTKSNFISSNFSHEFHSISNYGDKRIIYCLKTKRTEIFKKSYKIYKKYRFKPKENFKSIKYKDSISYKEIIENHIDKNKLLKIFICHANEKNFNKNLIALVTNYNYILCNKKIKNIKKILFPIKYANNFTIKKNLKFNNEFIGIINLNMPIILDYKLYLNSDLISTDNAIKKKFIFGINWNNLNIKKNIIEIADFTIDNIFNTNKYLKIYNSFELAHIFNLQDKYTKDTYKNKIFMGSYGIGISRLLFSTIENNIDEFGINFPINISPYKVCVIPINFYKSEIVNKITYLIYNKIKFLNIEVLLENRNKNFSYIIKDLDLIGIPIILIINEKNILNNLIEIKIRKYKNKSFFIKIKNIINIIKKILFY